MYCLIYFFFLRYRLSERQYRQLKCFQKGTEFGNFQVWAEKIFNPLICREYREGVGVAWSFISVILYFVIIYCYYIIF